MKQGVPVQLWIFASDGLTPIESWELRETETKSRWVQFQDLIEITLEEFRELAGIANCLTAPTTGFPYPAY